MDLQKLALSVAKSKSYERNFSIYVVTKCLLNASQRTKPLVTKIKQRIRSFDHDFTPNVDRVKERQKELNHQHC